MLTHGPSGRGGLVRGEGFLFRCHLQAKHNDMWFKLVLCHENTKRPILDANETWLVYSCGKKKGTRFLFLHTRCTGVIYFPNEDWLETQTQAGACHMNAVKWPGVGRVMWSWHDSQSCCRDVMCCAGLWQGNHYATSLGDAALPQKYIKLSTKQHVEVPLHLTLNTAISEAWCINFPFGVKKVRKLWCNEHAPQYSSYEFKYQVSLFKSIQC